MHIFEENNYKDFIIKKNISLPNNENEHIINELIEHKDTDIMILEDKNILIVMEFNSIKFYNITKNYELIYTFKEKIIIAMERFEDDKLLILCNPKYFKIISIYENKVFNAIRTDIEVVDVKYHKDKDIIIVGGTYRGNNRLVKICYSRIQIFRKDKFNNFFLVREISDKQYYTVNEIKILSDGNMAVCYGGAATFWNIDET